MTRQRRDALRSSPSLTPAPGLQGRELAGPQAYTVEQVAELLQVGRDKVYFLIRTGRLHSVKIGKLRRITVRQLAEFVAALEASEGRDDEEDSWPT